MTDKTSIKDIYKRAAVDYDDNFENLLEPVWSDAIDRMEITAHCSILDIGCGTGKIIQRIMERHGHHDLCIDGIDLSQEMIAAAKIKFGGYNGNRIELYCQDAMQYLKNCEMEKYDVVVVSFLLAYIDSSKLFPLIGKVLKKGGRVVIVTTSTDHTKECEKIFFGFALRNPTYFNWWTIFSKPLSLVAPIKKIRKQIWEAGFQDFEGKLILTKKTFDNFLGFLYWSAQSGYTTMYYDLLIKDKKEEAMAALERYAEKNFIYFGEQVKIGKPFNFTWPVYIISAVKTTGEKTV